MTDTKGAFGQTLSRRRLLGMGALAGIGVARLLGVRRREQRRTGRSG